MKRISNLSTAQAEFKDSLNGLAGWNVSAGTATLKRYDDKGAYPKYIPNGTVYEPSPIGNILTARPTTTDPIEVSSGFFSVSENTIYVASCIAAYFAQSDRKISLKVDFYAAQNDSSIIARDTTVNPAPVFEGIPASSYRSLSVFIVSPPTAQFAKIKFAFSNTATPPALATTDTLVLFDPVVHDFSNVPAFALAVYSLLPEFMRRDDENISSLIGGYQPILPLRTLIDALTYRLSAIDETVNDFTYTRATYGELSESSLTDPLTAPERYLPWLSKLNGTNLLSLASGFSPWAAVESYDSGFDYDAESGFVAGSLELGEWLDIGGQTPNPSDIENWIELENIDPDFFDTIQSYREQIKTGFSGINAGRKDAVESYIRTQLAATDPENRVVTFINNKSDNPHRSIILVDPSADPDPNGSLLANAINAAGVAGVQVEGTNIVEHTARAYYNMDELLPASTSTEDAVGSALFSKRFISDQSGHGQNILLNSTGDPNAPDLGGGIGTAHYENGKAFFFGDGCSILVGSSSGLDLSQATAFDIIVEVSHIHEDPATATAGTLGSTSSFDWWKWRNKRLLLSGNNSSDKSNDWALLLVSGATINNDPRMRLMFMSGYQNPTSTNYIVSDPINFAGETSSGSGFIRVRRKTNGNYELFFQKSLYDDWSTNRYGVGTLTSTITVPSTSNNSRMRILGTLDNSLSSDAGQLSTEVRRVLFLKNANYSTDSITTYDSAISVLNGNLIYTDNTYSYTPTYDINLSDYDNYEVSPAFGDVIATVQGPASNDKDIRIFRKNSASGNLWYFGYAASGGDVLTLTGLNSGTTYYPFFHEVNHDGTITTISGTAITGQTTATFNSATYGGKSLVAIEISTSNNNGGGTSPHANAIAYFTPSTLGAGASAGTDDLGGTWELQRNWPALTSTAYTPSQLINESYFSTYEGTLTVKKKIHLDNYTEFSLSGRLRRNWSDSSTVYNIYSILTSSGEGFRLYYSGTDIVAEYTDGSLVETVSWEESPIFGAWHNYVVRRSAQSGIQLFVDGAQVDTSTFLDLSAFVGETFTCSIGSGANNTFNSRLEVASLSAYDRYLSNQEIALLNTQLSV